MDNKPDKYKKLYEQACELLGKNKGDQNFDLIKQLNEVIKSRDTWKTAWVNQHSATGRAYWWGYNNGLAASNKEQVNPRGLRSKSAF